MYVTSEDKCFRTTGVRHREVPVLKCFQEETDGRFPLHTAHAAGEGFDTIMISSDDTDVLIVLGLVFCSTVKAPLYQKSGTWTQ